MEGNKVKTDNDTNFQTDSDTKECIEYNDEQLDHSSSTEDPLISESSGSTRSDADQECFNRDNTQTDQLTGFATEGGEQVCICILYCIYCFFHNPGSSERWVNLQYSFT